MEKSPATKVLILTAYSEEENILNTAKSRARGYLLKGVSSPTLVQVIKKVHAGAIWVDREIPAADAFEQIAPSQSFDYGPPANETLKSLTKRELEILMSSDGDGKGN